MTPRDPGRFRSDERRAALDFAGAVQVAFEFLVVGRGFRLVRSEPTLVRYESEPLFVNVFHGRGSYEVGVEIGILGDEETERHPFSLGELMRLEDAEAAERFRRPQISSDRLALAGAVREQSRLFWRLAEPLLAGKPGVVERLRTERRAATERYFREQELDRVRREAERAWQEKDHARLVELYRSIEDALTEVEAKRLAYASKRLNP